jgi:hypothetical protein
VYLIYVDDSGDHRHDLLVALCIPAVSWTVHLRDWKKYRQYLRRSFGLPPVVELHATEWLRRTDFTVADPVAGVDVKIPASVQRGAGELTRDDVFVKGLKTIASMGDVRVIGTYAPVASGSGGLYGRLVELIEEFLAQEEAMGIIWFDGTDPALETVLRQHHRTLDIGSRRVLEDPVPRSSAHSHLIQMADVAAYTLFARVRNAVDGTGRPQIVKAATFLDPLLARADPLGLDGFQPVQKRGRKKQ